MKGEKAIRYFGYALLLFGFLLMTQYLIEKFRHMASITYNTYPYVYTYIFSSIFIGALMGLETFLKEAAKKEKWKLNGEKLFFLGLPSLYFTFKNFLPLPGSPPLLLPFLPYINPDIIPILGLIFGYTLMTSFYK